MVYLIPENGEAPVVLDFPVTSPEIERIVPAGPAQHCIIVVAP